MPLPEFVRQFAYLGETAARGGNVMAPEVQRAISEAGVSVVRLFKTDLTFRKLGHTRSHQTAWPTRGPERTASAEAMELLSPKSIISQQQSELAEEVSAMLTLAWLETASGAAALELCIPVRQPDESDVDYARAARRFLDQLSANYTKTALATALVRQLDSPQRRHAADIDDGAPFFVSVGQELKRLREIRRDPDEVRAFLDEHVSVTDARAGAQALRARALGDVMDRGTGDRALEAEIAAGGTSRDAVQKAMNRLAGGMLTELVHRYQQSLRRDGGRLWVGVVRECLGRLRTVELPEDAASSKLTTDDAALLAAAWVGVLRRDAAAETPTVFAGRPLDVCLYEVQESAEALRTLCVASALIRRHHAPPPWRFVARLHHDQLRGYDVD